MINISSVKFRAILSNRFRDMRISKQTKITAEALPREKQAHELNK